MDLKNSTKKLETLSAILYGLPESLDTELVYCDDVRAKPRSRQICLARKDNKQADASRQMRDGRREYENAGGRPEA